jgi:predicted nucleic acid-binding Zn finger protein
MTRPLWMTFALESCSDHVKEKAHRLVEGSTVRQDDDHPEVWWVAGVNDLYRVQIGEGYLTCTCLYGRNRGGGQGGCSHIAAVLIKMGAAA